MFDWNIFSNIQTGGSLQYIFRSLYGSGTGNVFSNISGGCSVRGLSWEGGNSSNIGDILISNFHCHSAQAGVYLGNGGSYHERITICNSQFDAGVSAAFDVHGSYGHLKFTPILFGGATSYYLYTNPTYSILDLPGGRYSYNSSGTINTIAAY